jgi:fatty acid desaturase
MPGTLLAILQGAKVYEQQYKTFLILLGISALMVLVFTIYHEQIHGWIKKSKRRNDV